MPEFRAAVAQLGQARASQPGDSYASSAIHSLSASTIASYHQALLRLSSLTIRTGPPTLARTYLCLDPESDSSQEHDAPPGRPRSADPAPPSTGAGEPNQSAPTRPSPPRPSSARQALDLALLYSVQDGLSASYAKHVIAGVRLLEKMQWIPAVVRPADWLVVRLLEGAGSRNPRAKVWADLTIFRWIASRAESYEEWEAVALAVLSGCHLLRVSEAVTASRSASGDLRFYGCKSRRGQHVVEVGPFGARWLSFLDTWRQMHGRRRDVSGFASVDLLQSTFTKLVASSAWADARWHSLRRFGAAQLLAQGLPVTFLQIYGGWGSAKVALE